jgi:hypothetical protein
MQRILSKSKIVSFGCYALLLAMLAFSCDFAAAKSTASRQPSAGKTTKAPEWVQGVVYGEKFAVRKAFYGDGYLFLRSEFKPAPIILNEENRPDACNGIQIAVPTRESLEGRTFMVRLGEPTETRIEVNLFVVTEAGSIDGHLFQKVKQTSPFSMVLKFFKITNGLLPGYIELHCTDTTSHPTTIKGYFYAQPATGNAVRPSAF